MLTHVTITWTQDDIAPTYQDERGQWQTEDARYLITRYTATVTEGHIEHVDDVMEAGAELAALSFYDVAESPIRSLLQNHYLTGDPTDEDCFTTLEKWVQKKAGAETATVTINDLTN